MRRARTTTAALALAVALSVGACSTPLPEPEPDAVPASAVPVTSPEHAEDVVGRVLEALAASDESGTMEPVAGRIGGVAERMRTGQLVLAGAGIASNPTSVPTDVQTLVVPTDPQWPRTMLAVSEPPADLTPPVLVALVQQRARDPYRLAAWARLFPGTTLPATAQPSVGTPAPPPDEELLVPREEVLARYIDVVVNGDASPHAATFPADPVRSGLAETRATFTAAADAGTGTFSETHTPVEGSGLSVATADGGAIVLSTFESAFTLQLQESSITVSSPAIVAYLGTPTLRTSITVTQLTTVAVHVPPAGSTDPLRALGGDTTTVGASGS
ncbi:hypothetical protein Q9R32_08765 [Actinotalea sp. AC32]|nr:hypothetical protein [Actinotalea sp. AC32]